MIIINYPNEFAVDELIHQAVNASDKEFIGLIKRTILLLKQEQSAANSTRVDGRLVRLPPSGEAIIVADLHGDLHSLAHILKSSGFLGKAEKGENVHTIFLGDYGDRGQSSPEVYYAILKLKELFPEQVILMRGNHEAPLDLLPYFHDLPNFFNEKYGCEGGMKIYAEVRRLFDRLYSAIMIEGRVALIHGGVPSDAKSEKDLAYAHRRHPRQAHLEEMLWSDPREELSGTQPSTRGAGKFFGADVTEQFLQMLKVNVLIRGHEPCPEGYRISHGGKILTLFSTKGAPYDNKHAAYLQMTLSEGIRSAEQLKQHVKQF